MIESAELTPSGIVGDRIIQVRSATGRILNARTWPLLLRHRAALHPDYLVAVDGRPWDSAEVAREVEAASAPGARLVHSEEEDRFDILPLLVATDGTLEATGYDRRRFRPNLVIGGVEGLAERQWEGARLRIGRVVIGMEDLRGRCIMTTFDPDTGEQNLGVLRKIKKDFNGRLGLNSEVVAPGRITVGDPVEFIPAQ